MPGRNIARITTFLLLLLALAVIACAAAGLSAAQRNAARQTAAQHRSLEAALDELHLGSGETDHVDSAQVTLIERRSGLNGLRFDAELTADGGREVQSLHDPQGRIIGWLSWAPDRALAATMNWLWGAAGLFGILLALASALALGVTQRLIRSFHRNVDLVRKLTTQDPLTGLTNRRVLLDRLDAIMAARRNGVVVFLLFDVDGFNDVNDMLGWAGGDTMLVNIVERLKSGCPTARCSAVTRTTNSPSLSVLAVRRARPSFPTGSPPHSPRRSSWIRCGRSPSAWASPRRRKTARPATN